MRPSKDVYFLKMAQLVATRSTCARRSVGCVLVDSIGRVLATGYNGRPRGFQHCNEHSPCAGATLPSGTGLDTCEAIHAETNALLQCSNVDRVETCYVTCSPCVSCVKLLLNTSCRRIVFAERYAHDEVARELWERLNRVESPMWRTWLLSTEETANEA